MGRPPRANAAATEKITLRLTPAQRLELRRVAVDNDTDMSGVLREAVDEYIADYGERRQFARPRDRAGQRRGQ